MGEAGFEPAKAEPPDLQSGPFGRSGIPPQSTSCCWRVDRQRPFKQRPYVPCGPLHAAREASGGTRTHNLRFTKPGLCRLSYASPVILVGQQVGQYSNPIRPCKAESAVSSPPRGRLEHHHRPAPQQTNYDHRLSPGRGSRDSRHWPLAAASSAHGSPIAVSAPWSPRSDGRPARVSGVRTPRSDRTSV